MFLRHDGFLLHFLPKVKGKWAPLLEERRRAIASPRGDIGAMEEAGATHEEIALLVRDYFYAAIATFRGVRDGFSRKERHWNDFPRMALWLMEALLVPWPMPEVL